MAHLSSGSAAVDQHPQVLSHPAALQQLCTKAGELYGVVTQGQDLTLGLVEHHTTGLGPWIQRAQILL